MSQFDDAIGSMFSQAFDIIGGTACTYAGTNYNGVFDSFATELELVIGGKVQRARGQIVIPLSQFAVEAETPAAQKTILVGTQAWRIIKVDADELAFTCYLGGVNE
jgi:hypothetical protein